MTKLRYLTAGESHGPALTVVLEGIPAGLEIDADYIAAVLERRQKGFGAGGRMKIEKDRALIKAGVRHGVTLGSPIALWIENRDHSNWVDAMAVEAVEATVDTKPFTRLVPGHADFAGALKYQHHDLRDVLERASARETAARTAAGAVAMRFLETFGITVYAHVTAIRDISAEPRDPHTINWASVRDSQLRTDDDRLAREFKKVIKLAKQERTTVGGVVETFAIGMPVGLGSHVHWDRKLDGRLAQAMISINAVKGVEIGRGFDNTRRWGRDVQDVVVPDKTDRRGFSHPTNHAGGIEGGMSNGEPLVVRTAIKPIATMADPLPSVDINTGQIAKATYNRSDVCQVPRACAITETVLAFVLADAMLEKFGGDSMQETQHNFEAYLATHRQFGGRNPNP